MIPHTRLSYLQATEALAVVAVDLFGNGNLWERGELYGPRCTTARTLAATYVDRGPSPPGESFHRREFAIPDPCYWTPELPFLYDVDFYFSSDGACDRRLSGWLGLRGLQRHRLDLRLENRRHVLRGVVAPRLDEATRAAAQSVDAAVWTCSYDPDHLASAAQEGVWNVVDLRSYKENLDELLRHLNWNPSVAFVVLSAEQLHQQFTSRETRHDKSPQPRRLLLAQGVSTTADGTPLGASPTIVPGADVVAWERCGVEQPPRWLRDAKHPVVVRQRSVAYAELASARRGCDQLQADLATAGNLAGYFVDLGP